MMRFPLTMELRPSLHLRLVLVLLFVGTTTLGLLLPAQSYRMGVLCAVIFLAWPTLANLRPRLTAIRLERSGSLKIREIGREDYLEAQLLPGTIVHPWLTVIHLLSSDNVKHCVVVLGDSMTSPDFRVLRVFLRWQAEPTRWIRNGG